MSLMNKLKGLVGGDEDGSFTYECTKCGEQFESEHADMSAVDCPACDSGRVRTVTG